VRAQDCQFHGRHRTRLDVVEACRDCGMVRVRRRTSRLALWLVPAALWANALLLLALLVG
jgi:hypothetical protein